MNSELEQEFSNALRHFVTDRCTAFSKYDITKYIRKNSNLKFSHSKINDCLTNFIESEDEFNLFGFPTLVPQIISYTPSKDMCYGVKWVKTLCNFGGISFFVYHPQSFDAQAFYDPDGDTQVSIQDVADSIVEFDRTLTLTNSAPTLNLSVVNNQQTANEVAKIKTDYRNRLLIPNRFVKRAGLYPGDVAVVSCDYVNKKIHISLNGRPNNNVTSERTYVVAKAGEIRISHIVMLDAGMSETEFTVTNEEISGQKLVVISS